MIGTSAACPRRAEVTGCERDLDLCIQSPCPWDSTVDLGEEPADGRGRGGPVALRESQ